MYYQVVSQVDIYPTHCSRSDQDIVLQSLHVNTPPPPSPLNLYLNGKGGGQKIQYHPLQ